MYDAYEHVMYCFDSDHAVGVSAVLSGDRGIFQRPFRDVFERIVFRFQNTYESAVEIACVMP